MGVQSTLFGPVKYAILPQHLRREELTGGNGLVEMGTFVAILLGTIAGGILVAMAPGGPVWAGAVAVVVAVIGWLASRGIPHTPPVAPALRINWNPVSETWRNLRLAHRNRVVWRSMLGISWFWFYGTTFLAQFAGFTKDFLGGDETVTTFLLAVFSVGIGIGSLLCERLSGRRVEIGLVPFGAIGLTVFAVDLWFAAKGLRATGTAALAAFLADPAHWRVAFDLVMIGLFGGFYIVPLYAMIQERSEPTHRSRIIAANNIVNALFMVASAVIAIGLLQAGLSVVDLFLVTALMNAAVAIYIFTLVPEFLMRFIAWLLVHTMYRVARRGLEHVPDEGACVVACNHVSYVDAVVISAYVPRPIRFVMDHRIFETPVMGFVFRTMRAIPIASAKEDAARKERAFDRGARGARRGRDRRHLPRGAVDGRRRDAAVPARDRAHRRRDAGAGDPDGAAGPVGELLLPLVPGQGDAALARRVLAHRARRRHADSGRAGDARDAAASACSRCAASGADGRPCAVRAVSRSVRLADASGHAAATSAGSAIAEGGAQHVVGDVRQRRRLGIDLDDACAGGPVRSEAAPPPARPRPRCRRPASPRARRAASSARASASSGSVSSNQTTSGRRYAPQCGQRGGRSSPGGAQAATTRCSREHFTRAMLPCSSTRRRLPALACSPSTFCVASRKSGTRSSMRASARWPALGTMPASAARRDAYQSQTSFGLRANADGVASSRGSNFAHRPVCASRNVGTPDSAEMPAPVSTTTRVARRSARARSGAMAIACICCIVALPRPRAEGRAC